ncbi:hypothetical protein CFO_g2172 [Ceratocystis platani]|uniref:Small acidic protein n=1 Tax=Ceratocystis fimbriata f. sp. platani TaxID=88771 RepID=A0A0F8BSD8_CERFI|nr:hypothetical protein CFO_g2172 [Ceratocystis platani]
MTDTTKADPAPFVDERKARRQAERAKRAAVRKDEHEAANEAKKAAKANIPTPTTTDSSRKKSKPAPSAKAKGSKAKGKSKGKTKAEPNERKAEKKRLRLLKRAEKLEAQAIKLMAESKATREKYERMMTAMHNGKPVASKDEGDEDMKMEDSEKQEPGSDGSSSAEESESDDEESSDDGEENEEETDEQEQEQKEKKRKEDDAAKKEKKAKKSKKAQDKPTVEANASMPKNQEQHQESKPTSDNTKANWRVGALDGGAKRQQKFMRLLGAGKNAAAAATATGSVGKSEKTQVARMQADLQNQFEAGMRMKNEGRKGFALGMDS